MSKKLRTVEYLLDRIIAEQQWRRDELKQLDDTIYFHRAVPKRQNALLRASFAMLYAHWEGYVKIVCGYYLDYVSNQKLDFLNLHPAFIVRALEGTGNEKKLFQANIVKVQKLLDSLEKTATIPIKEIKTSNLNFEVFKEIYGGIGLDYSKYEIKETPINELVEIRNSIAHGKERLIDYSDYQQTFNLIFELIEGVADDIVDAANERKFEIKR